MFKTFRHMRGLLSIELCEDASMTGVMGVGVRVARVGDFRHLGDTSKRVRPMA